MKKGKWFLLIFVFGAALVSCLKQTTDTGNLYIPTPSDVTATATLDELTQGRALYIDNCERCHGLYVPESYSSAQWKSIMSKMGPKTRLTTAEISFVTKYVSHGK